MEVLGVFIVTLTYESVSLCGCWTTLSSYITLLNTIKVTEPLSVNYGERKVCIVDDGYMWLQQFPLEKNHSVTRMFDANGDIVQWYIDICLRNGVENNVPWMDDLFLDIVVLPNGEIIEKDADELEEAQPIIKKKYESDEQNKCDD